MNIVVQDYLVYDKELFFYFIKETRAWSLPDHYPPNWEMFYLTRGVWLELRMYNGGENVIRRNMHNGENLI